jgi:hypothetical protein
MSERLPAAPLSSVRLAEQAREWFAAAQRESDERTRIATGIKFMWPLQREAWLRRIAQLIREPNRWMSSGPSLTK